jgi:hypothetical protein
MPGGGTQLPPLSSQQLQDLMKGPTLQPVKDIRPGQCTKDDPQGTASNGTDGRIYTQSVRSYDPIEAEKQRIENMRSSWPPTLNIHSWKASGSWGPFKAGYDSTKGPSAGLKEPKDDPTSAGKKKRWVPEGKAEVCIQKNGHTKKDGSWFNYEFKGLGVTHSAGFPDGAWCIGADSGALKPDFNTW